MKGEFRLKILEFMKDSVQLLDDLLIVFTSPYGTAYSRMEALMEKERELRDRGEITEIGRKTRRRFSDFLYRLKKDGLVCEEKKRGKCFFKITPKGTDFLKKLSDNLLPDGKYESLQDKTLKIVIFDIPESEKGKREWLRCVLKGLGFRMLQKSVWAGKIKLPEGFIKDLEKINILSYVEIFAISKSGSLRQVTNF